MEPVSRSDFAQSIRTILQLGGGVEFSYKTRWKDWFQEVSLSAHRDVCYYRGPNGSGLHSIEEGIELLISEVFVWKNLALSYQGARRQLPDDNIIDTLADDEIVRLVKKYREEQLLKDYPFIQKPEKKQDGKTVSG